MAKKEDEKALITKKEKRDSKLRKTKIIKARLKNSTKTVKEIAKEQGISERTVYRIQKTMAETVSKDDRILGLTDKWLKTIEEGSNIYAERFQDEDWRKKARLSEVASALTELTNRYTKFRGSATDEMGGEKGLDFSIVLDEGE